MLRCPSTVAHILAKPSHFSAIFCMFNMTLAITAVFCMLTITLVVRATEGIRAKTARQQTALT